jgi:hypothetical protein
VAGPRIWFDPPLFGWRRVLVTALVAVAFVLGWLANERGLWRDTPPATTAATIAAASAPATVPAPASAPAQAAPVVASTRPLARVAVAAPASAPPRKPGPGEIEICGVGIVKADEGAAAELAQRRPSPARAAWQAALLASADVRVRAAGIRIAGGTDTHDKLARLAADSRDPLVYTLAMNACQPMGRVPNPGWCQLISHEQWVTVDPDNAFPWLQLADAAVARRTDPSEALHRAAQAKVLKSYTGALHGLVMAAQPPNTPAPDRVLMAFDAADASAAAPSLGPVTAFCAAPALRDVNRRQTCEALATLFVERGDTLVALALGRAIGERLGWPAERLAALRDERDALLALQVERPASSEPLGCAALEKQTAYFADVARRGELGALREALRRSGRNIDALARDYRAGASAPRS